MDIPEFKRGFRGYDSNAVDQAWAETYRQLSETNAANQELRLQVNSLREQNSELEKRLKYYEQIEKELRDALVSAQRIANQIKDDAGKQAEDLMQTARSESEQMIQEATRLSELKEIEFDTTLSEKRTEINELEIQIQGLTLQKADLQAIIDQIEHYLTNIKDLIQ